MDTSTTGMGSAVAGTALVLCSYALLFAPAPGEGFAVNAVRIFNLLGLLLLVLLPLSARVSGRGRRLFERVLPLSPLALALPMIANQLGAKLAGLLVSGNPQAGLSPDSALYEPVLSTLMVLIACCLACSPQAVASSPRTVAAQKPVPAVAGVQVGC